MTEIEDSSEIFTKFKERHIELSAKIEELRSEIQKIAPTNENPFIWDFLDQQERQIEGLQKKVQEKSKNPEIYDFLTPEKSESQIVEEELDFEKAVIQDNNFNHLSDKLRLHLGQKSQNERIFVDEMLIFGNLNLLSLWRNGRCDLKIPGDSAKLKKVLPRILNHIFEICIIQNLIVYDLPDEYSRVFESSKFSTIHVENVFSKSLEDPTAALLKSCNTETVKVVELDAFDATSSKIQKVTAAIRVPRMHFLKMNGNTIKCTILIKNWICYSPEMGSELTIEHIGSDFDVDKFFSRFCKGLVRQYGKWEREVRTTETAKNVQLQLIPAIATIKCTVIQPSNTV